MTRVGQYDGPAGRGLTTAGGLGKRNSRRKARLEIEGADEVMFAMAVILAASIAPMPFE